MLVYAEESRKVRLVFPGIHQDIHYSLLDIEYSSILGKIKITTSKTINQKND